MKHFFNIHSMRLLRLHIRLFYLRFIVLLLVLKREIGKKVHVPQVRVSYTFKIKPLYMLLLGVLLSVGIFYFIGLYSVPSQASTKPCSHTHNCLKNHTYADGYTTSSTLINPSDSSQGYTIAVGCDQYLSSCNGTATTQTSQKSTSKGKNQSTSTGKDSNDDTDKTDSSTSQKSTTTTPIATSTASDSSQKDITNGSTLQKLGPYMPSDVYQKFLAELHASNKVHSSKSFTPHFLIDIDYDTGDIVVSCVDTCNARTFLEGDTFTAFITSSSETVESYISIDDNGHSVHVDVNNAYTEVNAISDSGHLYLIIE